MTTPQFALQQGFAPQQQFAPQPVPAAPALNPSAWAVAAADDAGGNGVVMAHFRGRTVAIVPLELLENRPIPKQPGKFQDVIRADVFVLDGGPFVFGGSPDSKPPKPDTQVVNQLPYLAENCRIYGVVIVDQLRSKVREGVSVGQVYKKLTGTGNEAWALSTDATPEQLTMVQQLVNAHYQHRAFANPTPVQLAPQPAYQQAPQYAPQPNLAPQWPAAQPGVVAQPMAYAQPQQAPQPAQPQFQAPAVPQFAGFAPSAPPAMEDWTLNTMPPGVPAEQLHAWQTTTTQEARTQMLAAAGITGPGPVNPGRPTGL